MKIIDLTQTISEKMPVYPGTAQPELTVANSISSDGFWETMLAMTSHTGTHIDAPAHILPDALTLDKLPIEQFYGTARIFDVRRYAGQQISLSVFQDWRSELSCYNFVILKSDHDRYWGSDYYFRDYPILSGQAAAFLAGLPNLQGIGMDMISPDALDSTDFPIHKIFFAAGKIIIENLTNLDAIEGNTTNFSVMPLKIAGAEGSPVRAIAFVDDLY